MMKQLFLSAALVAPQAALCPARWAQVPPKSRTSL